MQSSPKSGFLYLALIGLFLTLLGGVFVVILGRGYLRARETHDWKVCQGTIIQSTVKERELGPAVPREYSHDLVYRYRVDDEVFLGDRVKRRENPFFKEKAKAEGWVADWPVGSPVDVFVNPANPREAVLDHETKAAGYSIWFPGVFFLGGLVICVRSLRGIFAKNTSVLH